MTAGDLKGPCTVIEVDAGGAVTKGDVVHIESDGYWDPVVDTDTGKFGVALDAATSEGDDIRVVIWGPVEVTAAAAIPKGAVVMPPTAGDTAGQVIKTDHGAVGENIGTAMEAAAAAAATLTIWVGLVD
jgi:hypothetical protein